MLNRGVLIVRPKQPYLDWAAALDDSGLVPDPDDERTVYLIPSFEDDDEAWEIIEDIYTEVFERELEAWHTDAAAWPPKRDLAMFKEWFDIEFHSVVEDLGGDEIIDDGQRHLLGAATRAEQCASSRTLGGLEHDQVSPCCCCEGRRPP